MKLQDFLERRKVLSSDLRQNYSMYIGADGESGAILELKKFVEDLSNGSSDRKQELENMLKNKKTLGLQIMRVPLFVNFQLQVGIF